MKKLLGLRDHILELTGISTETLSVYAADGRLVGTAQNAVEYRYQGEVTITEYNGQADNVLWPIYAWVRDHQPDISSDDLEFEVDLLDHEGVDLAVRIPLTEAVRRDPTTGGFTHCDPVEPADLYGPHPTV